MTELLGWDCNACGRISGNPWDRRCGDPERKIKIHWSDGTVTLETPACPLRPVYGPGRPSLWKRIRKWMGLT